MSICTIIRKQRRQKKMRINEILTTTGSERGRRVNIGRIVCVELKEWHIKSAYTLMRVFAINDDPRHDLRLYRFCKHCLTIKPQISHEERKYAAYFTVHHARCYRCAALSQQRRSDDTRQVIYCKYCADCSNISEGRLDN